MTILKEKQWPRLRREDLKQVWGRIISSAIVLTLIITVVCVNKSKADSNKVKDTKPGATTEVEADLDDDKVNLNVDAADHGSVMLPGGASSKDIVRR